MNGLNKLRVKESDYFELFYFQGRFFGENKLDHHKTSAKSYCSLGSLKNNGLSVADIEIFRPCLEAKENG